MYLSAPANGDMTLQTLKLTENESFLPGLLIF